MTTPAPKPRRIGLADGGCVIERRTARGGKRASRSLDAPPGCGVETRGTARPD